MRSAAEMTGQIMPLPRPEPAASSRNPIPDSLTSVRASPHNRRSLEYSATPPDFHDPRGIARIRRPEVKAQDLHFTLILGGRDRKAAPNRRVARDARQSFAE
jgi:hypothetical protein